MLGNNTVQRTRRSILAAIAIFVLSGCGGGAPFPVPPGVNTGLHLACQTVECECVAGKGGIFDSKEKADIRWSKNGDASCPKGFELQRIRRDILGRKL